MAKTNREVLHDEMERVGFPLYAAADHLSVPISEDAALQTVRLLKIFVPDTGVDVLLRLSVAAVPPERVGVVLLHLNYLNCTYAFHQWAVEDGVVVLSWTLQMVGEAGASVVMAQICRMLRADTHHRQEILELARAGRKRRPRAERQAARIVSALP